ncbi:hypothetical protein JL720_11868 [Aureococcus anophagefferens]|nr:hypothetical protein JL720_11868 [Aureococcus anophagefferens]
MAAPTTVAPSSTSKAHARLNAACDAAPYGDAAASDVDAASPDYAAPLDDEDTARSEPGASPLDDDDAARYELDAAADAGEREAAGEAAPAGSAALLPSTLEDYVTLWMVAWSACFAVAAVVAALDRARPPPSWRNAKRGEAVRRVLNTRFDVRFRGAPLFLDRAALAPGAFYGVVHPATPGVHPREFVDDKLCGAGSEAARAAGAVFDLLPDLAVNTPYGALKSKGGITNRVEEIANVAGAAPFEFSNRNLERGVLRLLGDDASVFRHLCDALRDDGGGACTLEAVSELDRGGDGDTACAAVACVDEGCLVHVRRWHLTRLP